MDLLGMKSGRRFQTFGIASLVFLKLVFQCAALFIYLYIITQMGTDTRRRVHVRTQYTGHKMIRCLKLKTVSMRYIREFKCSYTFQGLWFPKMVCPYRKWRVYSSWTKVLLGGVLSCSSDPSFFPIHKETKCFLTCLDTRFASTDDPGEVSDTFTQMG